MALACLIAAFLSASSEASDWLMRSNAADEGKSSGVVLGVLGIVAGTQA